jgi:hypothetical protein
MAIRIRKNGKILCAAFNDPEAGDLYMDDHFHYEMVHNGVIKPVDPDDGNEWRILRKDVIDAIVYLETLKIKLIKGEIKMDEIKVDKSVEKLMAG